MRNASHFIVFLLLAACIGCGPSLKRIGYEKPTASTREDCEVTFIETKQNEKVPGRLLGTIKIGDSGVSMNCDERRVRSILWDEACKIGADIVVLREIKKPGFMSSCYRVTADLVQSSDTIGLETYLALQKPTAPPPTPPKTTIYGTVGYSGAAMAKLNESLEHIGSELRAAGYPMDIQTFDAGGIELGAGIQAKLKPSFSLGVDLTFQSMSVENRYADENLELSDEIEANMICLENRAEYWPRAVPGLSIGGILGVPFGKYHEVLSLAQQDPINMSYDDISFWSIGFSVGAFIGYELPLGSRGVMLARAGYRYRVLSSQFNAVNFVDALGEQIETDFSGFYVLAGLGFRVKQSYQTGN